MVSVRHIAQAARVCRSEFVALTSVRMLRSFRFLVIAIVSVSCTGQPTEVSDHGDLRTDQAAYEEFDRCMADAGYPDQGRGGSPGAGSPGLATPLRTMDVDRAFDAASERCGVRIGIAEVDGDTPEEQAAKDRIARDMTNCMRDRGWPVADPVVAPYRDYLLPDINPPPGADAETTEAFMRELGECSVAAGIPIEGLDAE